MACYNIRTMEGAHSDNETNPQADMLDKLEELSLCLQRHRLRDRDFLGEDEQTRGFLLERLNADLHTVADVDRGALENAIIENTPVDINTRMRIYGGRGTYVEDDIGQGSGSTFYPGEVGTQSYNTVYGTIVDADNQSVRAGLLILGASPELVVFHPY